MKRLADGETVVVDVRPHWWYLTGPIFVLLVVIGGGIAALVENAPGWAGWIIVGVLALSALWLLGRYLRWVTTRLIVTNTRIIERRGILGRTGREIPLTALTDIGYRQSLFERVIGAGDVVIESAGKEGQEVFPDLPHPATIHNQIYAQLQGRFAPAPGTAAAPVGPTTAPPVAPATIPEQIDQLDQLRRRGIITEREFEAKKAELLDRM